MLDQDLKQVLSKKEDFNFLFKGKKNFYFSNGDILLVNDSSFFGLQQVIALEEIMGVDANLHLRNFTQSTFGINLNSMENFLRENSKDGQIDSLSEKYRIYQVGGNEKYSILVTPSNRVTLANDIYITYFKSKGPVEYWQAEPDKRILVKQHTDKKVLGVIMPCRSDFKEMHITP